MLLGHAAAGYACVDMTRYRLTQFTILVLFAAAVVVARGQTPAEETERKPDSLREQKVKKLLDYLEDEYAKKTTAPYWVTRAMGTISLARIPRSTATAKLFEILEKDKQEVVRLLAWQALLPRANDMDAKAFARFTAQTQSMAERDMFRGGLRAPLLRVLACTPPNPRLKKVWEKLFTDCNSWEPEDVPVLEALGDCLKSWRSPQSVDGLINLLSNTNACLRAEIVLHHAGCPVRKTVSTLSPDIFNPISPKRSHPSWGDMWAATRKECEDWWHGEKPRWKETTKVEGTPWHDLKPVFVAAPFAVASIDPDDKLWYQDLELGKADINQIEAAFLVDATGSMGDVLEWLKRDLGRTATALQLICKEPAMLGVTFYRDYDDPWHVKLLPLTARLQTIEPDVVAMTADGGGDIPEAVLPALKDTIEKNKWSKRAKGGPKVIILIGDAPPHSNEMTGIIALAKKCPENGMKILAAKVKTELGRNDLTSFDEIVQACGGATVDVEFKRPVDFRIVDMVGKDIPYRTIERPEAQFTVPQADLEPPGEKILTLVISDAINPQYRNRVEPLARTLLAFSARPSKPEVRKPFSANTPPLERGMLKTQ
jgi:hypothetical protein